MSFTQERQQTEIHRKSNANKKNSTGIPLQMKQQYEKLSGLSFDDVRVHYNSDKPAQFQALAYTQGNQVFIGPGQETHLSHELGHVVQQKQGIVHPTKMINKIPVNDDPRLEAQCDTMINMAPTMQYRFDGQNNNNITVQLFRLRGTDCYNLDDVVRKLRELKYNTETDKLGNVDKLICIDGEGSLDLSDITGDIRNLNPISTKIKNYFDDIGKLELLKKFYMFLSQNSYIPPKTDLRRNITFTENIFGLADMLPPLILKKINEYVSAPGMIDFFYALQYHSRMEREDFSIGENIDSNDITDAFNQSKSCVITALLYAEETVFGASEPRELHNILVTYFSDYQKSQEGDAPNIKNNVWKNYSDDHVYPSLYEYLGYSKKSISPNPKLKNLGNIADLKGTKGIVVVERHAIGYKLNESTLNLKDNDNGNNIDSILRLNGEKKVIAIYYKKL